MSVQIDLGGKLDNMCSEDTIKASSRQLRKPLDNLFSVQMDPRETFDPDEQTWEQRIFEARQAGQAQERRLNSQIRERYVQLALHQPSLPAEPLRDPFELSDADMESNSARGCQSSHHVYTICCNNDSQWDEDLDLPASALLASFYPLQRYPKD
ncbi:hypothetical protein DL93DRAFT_2073231 [Clavulina sp. PMI_390]|nr:hypothetical protein DL93DRAFT_2073231 [Clavulina sp. PMI_390]